MEKTLDAIVAGDANVDLLLSGAKRLVDGKELLIAGASLVLGGSSGITAFNLARLGAKVGFVGNVGDDLFGRFVRERLVSAGIDATMLRTVAAPKSGITVWATNGAFKAGLTYPGTIATLQAKDVTSAYLSRARHLHVGAYFLQTKLHRGAPALFRRAQRLGLTTSLDGNWDDSEKWDSNILATLAHTDIFFPNEDEALRISRRRTVRAAAEVLAQFARVVVVKRGGRGALILSKLGYLEVPARKTRVVDTTGAGDSFNAGFLEAYLRGEDLAVCAKAGSAAGARAVRKVGGTTAFE